MKQFEKWLDKEIRPNQADPKEFPFTAAFEIEVNRVREVVWRAALEWAKREAISLDERGDISREIINRELGKG